ncbi:putative E3 ubiquitin-protein ligase [Diatrype stigma]|uniref:HECT-type E3 ubiquitin transferase n=1 Tax=Diatrype stigma TaxID=117547 RepID=A0AAN9YV24_9PEZI
MGPGKQRWSLATFMIVPPVHHGQMAKLPIQGPSGSTSKEPFKSSPVDNDVLDDFADLSLEPNPLKGEPSPSELRSYSASFPEARSSTFPPTLTINQDNTAANPSAAELDPKKIFKDVEDYLVHCFTSHSCINNSFVTRRLSVSSRHPPEAARKRTPETRQQRRAVPDDAPLSELDPKLLLVGDFAENGAWWTGGREEAPAPTRVPSRRRDDHPSIVNPRSPRIDWGQVTEWYHMVMNSAESWHDAYEEMVRLESSTRVPDAALRQFETLLLSAQEHLQRALLKCTEVLLKRPGRPMAEPQDVRFLLILLANPLLTPGSTSHAGRFQHLGKGKAAARDPESERQAKSIPGRHSGIIKRILGLLSNSSEQCHQYLIVWLSKLPEYMFLQIKDLVANFVTYRLTRVSEKTVEAKVDMTGGLVPEMPNARSANTPASLHAALATGKSNKKDKQPAEPKRSAYIDDWQIKTGAKVMALVFAANNLTHVRRNDGFDGRNHGHLLATSDFYNTLVDYLDFKDDFEMWESKTSKFAFCQYPFFLSIWAKIQILEHDAKRQMRGKARDAFFDSILNHRMYTQHLVLHIRRECLVDDSLKQVSEVVGSGSEDIKKALRIEFQGEEGVDAGGLRKEWFLLLVREVFNPDHGESSSNACPRVHAQLTVLGLFAYDEDSQFCYFNSNSFETSDQFFLVGVVLGLAIYNSTILDVALPPFAFRKLLASAPVPAVGAAAHPRPTMNYTLDDLAEYRPALARGLRQLLEYEGDVQATFCLDFLIEVEKYGARVKVPLLPGGESRMVTNSNRREYVDLYVRYLLDSSVARQFEPFKRGFFTVCGGNALSLFRPEEIELLVRGSDEPLDILSIKGSTEYTNWPAQQQQQPANSGSHSKPAPFNPEGEPTLRWFWATFERATPQDQRRLLSFITGSDRIPATGAASLVIRVNCLGPDEGRFPTARTCFNQLSLYRCRSRERLESSLWRAVHESEGFGLR